MLPTYFVRPHRAGGHAVTGSLLPRPIRYMNDAHAASYAHRMLRESGGRVVVIDSSGYVVITEHVEPRSRGCAC